MIFAIAMDPHRLPARPRQGALRASGTRRTPSSAPWPIPSAWSSPPVPSWSRWSSPSHRLNPHLVPPPTLENRSTPCAVPRHAAPAAGPPGPAAANTPTRCGPPPQTSGAPPPTTGPEGQLAHSRPQWV